MTPAPTPSRPARSLRAPVLWGVVFGAIQAASPLGFSWLDPVTVYALSLTLIAAVYIGFAVADGRPAVIAVEAGIAGVFVVVAAVGVTGPAWLLVLGLTGHGSRPACACHLSKMSLIHMVRHEMNSLGRAKREARRDRTSDHRLSMSAPSSQIALVRQRGSARRT